MQQEKRQPQSQPEPPSPAPGQKPYQVLELWEQYLDPSTGRSFYVNSITKERSWKPPRRARGRSGNKVMQLALMGFNNLNSLVFTASALMMTLIAGNSYLTTTFHIRASYYSVSPTGFMHNWWFWLFPLCPNLVLSLFVCQCKCVIFYLIFFDKFTKQPDRSTSGLLH